MIAFTQHELLSSAYLKLKEHCEERIDYLHLKNDGDLDDKETARVRGEIRAYKNLLAAGQPQRPTLVEDDAA